MYTHDGANAKFNTTVTHLNGLQCTAVDKVAVTQLQVSLKAIEDCLHLTVN
jgi:hypothetical protein